MSHCQISFVSLSKGQDDFLQFVRIEVCNIGSTCITLIQHIVFVRKDICLSKHIGGAVGVVGNATFCHALRAKMKSTLILHTIYDVFPSETASGST